MGVEDADELLACGCDVVLANCPAIPDMVARLLFFTSCTFTLSVHSDFIAKLAVLFLPDGYWLLSTISFTSARLICCSTPLASL